MQKGPFSRLLLQNPLLNNSDGFGFGFIFHEKLGAPLMELMAKFIRANYQDWVQPLLSAARLNDIRHPPT